MVSVPNSFIQDSRRAETVMFNAVSLTYHWDSPAQFAYRIRQLHSVQLLAKISNIRPYTAFLLFVPFTTICRRALSLRWLDIEIAYNDKSSDYLSKIYRRRAQDEKDHG